MGSPVPNAAIPGLLRLPIAYKPGPTAADLGYLRVTVSSSGHDTPEEVEASSVTNVRIISGSVFKDMPGSLEFAIPNEAT